MTFITCVLFKNIQSSCGSTPIRINYLVAKDKNVNQIVEHIGSVEMITDPFAKYLDRKALLSIENHWVF